MDEHDGYSRSIDAALPDRRVLVGRGCVHCGAPARVQSLLGYVGGQADLQFTCLRCFERPAARSSRISVAPRHAGLVLALLAGGSFVTAFAVSADGLHPGGSAGFGWSQLAGVLLGGLLALVGMLFRVHAVIAVGVLIFLVAAVSDLLGPGEAGMGWRQTTAVAAGVGLMGAGVVEYLAQSRRGGSELLEALERTGQGCNR